MKKIINVGLAGYGMSGKIFQTPFLDADARFCLKKVYERSGEKSKEDYPSVEIVRSFEELLTEDIDLVVISTPNAFHYPMAEQAIKAGKNVIVEKPVAATSEEAMELCRLAKEKKVLFSVYQNRRLDGDFVTVKKLIQEGRLGEVLDYEAHFDRFVSGLSSKAWKNESVKGVGILYDLGVHIIDQAVALFGMPLEVYADFRKQRYESVGIDNFQIIMYYDGIKAVVSAGQVVKECGPHYAVHGRKGSFIKYGMDVQEGALIAGDRPGKADWGKDLEENWGILNTLAGDQEYKGKIETQIGNYGDYYDNIYKVMTQGASLLVKPEETVQVLKIIEAAEKSNEEKRRITM